MPDDVPVFASRPLSRMADSPLKGPATSLREACDAKLRHASHICKIFLYDFEKGIWTRKANIQLYVRIILLYAFGMTVDMWALKFEQKLKDLPKFQNPWVPLDHVSKYGFPAWCSFFASVLNDGHGKGYQLPSFNDFFDRVSSCLKSPSWNGKYHWLFDETCLEGLLHKASILYASLIADAHLRCCLAWIIEDEYKQGLVHYDPRHDWKFKIDAEVRMNGRVIAISACHGSQDNRPMVTDTREQAERMRKEKTMNSSHFKNQEFKRTKFLEIYRDINNCEVINGFRLFSKASIDDLLNRIYCACGLSKEYRRFFSQYPAWTPAANPAGTGFLA